MITLKALSFFDDVPTLSADVRKHLIFAIEAVNPSRFPELRPYTKRADEKEHAP
jgi:hypothetical protein